MLSLSHHNGFRAEFLSRKKPILINYILQAFWVCIFIMEICVPALNVKLNCANYTIYAYYKRGVLPVWSRSFFLKLFSPASSNWNPTIILSWNYFYDIVESFWPSEKFMEIWFEFARNFLFGSPLLCLCVKFFCFVNIFTQRELRQPLCSYQSKANREPIFMHK